MNLNEKKLSVSEINRVCNKVYGEYAQMFSADRLDYKDLAFEVSRHKKCIDDMRKDGDVE